MKVLFIGDIMGRPGRTMLSIHLKRLIEENNIDVVIANGENASGGRGLTLETADELFSYGVDVLTMGNHVWDQRDLSQNIHKEPRIVRPINFPEGTPGKGYYIYEKGPITLAVVNAMGRVFLQENDCPFRTIEKELKQLKGITNHIIVDFHAEATSEKQALSWFLDGKVSAVIGTHTHVQTADYRLLHEGTAYVSDAGMTGPMDSCLGMEKEAVINKFLSQMPARFQVAEGRRQINGVIITIGKDGKAESIVPCNHYE